MNEEQQDNEIPVSEEQEIVEQPLVEETRTNQRVVPIEALAAERKKRQELEAKNQALQELMMNSKAKVAEEEPEDEEEFVTKAEMKRRMDKISFSQKREILEGAFLDAKPEAEKLISEHLDEIIQRKPWLAQTIESAPNRYARAYEIVQDYMPKEEKVAPASKFARPQADAKKIVENSQKPGNPATISKAAQGSNIDYLKSIAGKAEFREYRKKVLAGG